MSAWTDKPCVRCGRNKGPKFRDRKYCYRCSQAEKKAQAERAHRKRVSRVYDIGPDDYDRLLVIQDGRCALCRRATGKTRRLSVDHDHKTGKVRGLLCRPCNDLLGHARDDPLFFGRAIAYLYEPPANAL